MMANIKNLIAIDGNEEIVWNSESGVLEAGESDAKQTLLLTSRPYFSVKDIKLSPARNLLALSGDNGLTIVELPRRWGRRYKIDQENQVYCKAFNINERLYRCEKRLRVAHVEWHPHGNEAKQVICVLSNDNRLRLYDVTTDTQLQVIHLNPQSNFANADADSDDGNTTNLGISMLNLGETALCFDFGPPIVRQQSEVLWPVYILMGTGEIFLVYTNLKNLTYAEHIIGPLTMLPQAEDTYCSDACSLIVLDSSPALLAIATLSGSIYHCFSIAETEALLTVPTLFVYESIELSKDLIQNPDDPYNQQSMKLFKDPTSEIRYFCVHSNGVHTVVLPILETLQTQCDIDQDKESFSEFLVCTRTTSPSDANESIEDKSTPRGLGIEIRQTNIVLLVLMPSNELLAQRISPATTLINRKRFPRHNLDTSRDSTTDQEILNVSQIDASRANFEDQIQQILKRKASVPVLKLSEDLQDKNQIAELINNTVVTFKSEYINKYNLANEAIKKKLSILQKDMEHQKLEYSKIAKEKEEVYLSVVAISSKAEMACEKQKVLLKRIDGILSAVAYGHPDLSEAESKLKTDLTLLFEKLRYYRDQLDSVENKHKFHVSQKDPAFGANSDLILSPTQLSRIKETLTRQGADIAELKQAIKAKQK